MLKILILIGCFALVYSDCLSGWFGSNCQYKCHCMSVPCNDQGLCVGSRCERGWFGPLCQYQDLAVLSIIVPGTTSTSLNDGDGNTCTTVRNVTFKLPAQYKISSIRIQLKNSDSLKQFRLNLQESEASVVLKCEDQKLNNLNETVTDVFCNINKTVQLVHANFNVSTSVCSININGGRNVALKQHTWQSGTFAENGISYNSSKAVDGDTNNIFSENSCTHTAEKSRGTWRVTFSTPMNINRYVLYNRGDENRVRLKGFNLTNFNSDNQATFMCTDSNQNALDIYTLATTSAQSVAYVEITVTDILTLCEVEIYEGCDIGWFGPSCQYKCRCTNNYCDVSGGCYGGASCDRGWFGPLCQYQDLVTLNATITPSHNVLTDGDDKTCDYVQNLTISWKNAQTINWIRIKGIISGPSSDITIKYKIGNQLPIAYPILSIKQVDENTTDIVCNVSIKADLLYIYVNFNSSVCSVYINGGRNVAIKMSTSQSTNYIESEIVYDATRAVDGNPNTHFYEQMSCTHTQGSQPGNWTLSFPQPQTVSRYVLYNRYDILERLKGFKLISYNYNDKIVANYSDTNQQAQLIYRVPNTELVAVSKIKIFANEILTLCEVEVYGDQVCKDNTYGLDCSSKCNCTNRTSPTCFVATGQCLGVCVSGFTGDMCDQICKTGFYGEDCSYRCSNNCSKKSCDRFNGHCFSCVPGNEGDFCDRVCDSQHFGPNCINNCSSTCKESACDRTNGYCNECIWGHDGEFCNISCDDNHYGPKCIYNCSLNCDQSKCNKTNGYCNTCIPGYKGNICNITCDQNHYGPNCLNNCSSNCENTRCNGTSGRCDSCIAGYEGDFCNIPCSRQHYGPNCRNTCSTNCQDLECESKLGHCYNCIAGYQGEICNKTCDNDRYGVNCKENCSHWCKQNETQTWCNKTDGQCLIGCNNGFKEENTECSSWSLESKADDNATTLVPIVVPIVVVLMITMLAVASVVFWRRRKQNKNKNTGDNSRQGSNNVITTTFGADEGTDHTREKGDSPKAKRKVAIVNAYCNATDSTFIQVSQLNEFMRAKNSEYFAKQFKSIPAPQNVSMSAGLNEENRNKNRYKNICAYDHSRVHLEINTSKNEGDYINASYIEGYNNEEKFIASQGPTDVNINDFMRMLWEQRVDKVVMLTKLIEEGKVKCVSYWPDEGTTTFGDIKVNLAATHVFADYTIRKLELIKKGKTTHQFTQFHFTSWPDQGAPITPWGLVDFEQRVALDKTPKPILVHCSAGVGRTGTFIALRNVMREAEDTGQINCFQTVAKLRQDRVLMVQTAEQYEFLHKAAQVAIVCMGTTVTYNNITSRISDLEEQLVTGSCKLEKEFKAVSEVCLDLVQEKDDNTQGVNSNIYQNNTSSNSTKDRFSSIIPSKLYQAVLSKESNNLGDYINAVLVSGFTKGENQILTQLPMPNTVTDFWRLVAQYNVKLVMAFQTKESVQEESYGQYLPASITTPLDCGPYEIHIGPVKSESLWEEQQITVRVVKKTSSILSVANETQVTHITSKSTDLNPKNLLKLLKHTRSNNVQAQGRVLYMCRNGAEYSGLACVLSLLLDRMDHDQSLTVPLVVGAIKCIRPQVIPSLDQYRCLYQVLKRYNETTQTYNNYDQLSTTRQTEENVYANS